MDLLYKEESYAVIGACSEVYNDKGCGFLEAVYQECLELEFGFRNVPHQPQAELTLAYKGRPLKTRYYPDFLCFDKIVVEIKAATEIDDAHRAQLHNYLKATGHRLGLLVNFGRPGKLQTERIVR